MPGNGFQAPDAREECVYMAKLCEQAERYDEMVVCAKRLVKISPELTVEERNLLSVAYKNIVVPRRTSWRIVSSIEQNEDAKGSAQLENMRNISNYKKLFETELGEICEDLCNMLDQLIPVAKTGEDQVFYYKMKGDYFRYWAEVGNSDGQQGHAQEAYLKASEIAGRILPSTHPVRLGVALNFSVYQYEILRQPDRAIDTAKRIFDAAVGELEALDEEAYRESTAIMQLIRDNLTLWKEETRERADGDD
eukprot:Hpha_TRINITY_DN11692_c0_g2::TRINITY_DN11692_c0_g2_i1::g.48928::m.48928/K06630/YWHAE; 14-3-3 protein epsilon